LHSPVTIHLARGTHKMLDLLKWCLTSTYQILIHFPLSTVWHYNLLQKNLKINSFWSQCCVQPLVREPYRLSSSEVLSTKYTYNEYDMKIWTTISFNIYIRFKWSLAYNIF
jgi:hypothetical protein